jgi:hypothetical protein
MYKNIKKNAYNYIKINKNIKKMHKNIKKIHINTKKCLKYKKIHKNI